MCLSSSGVLSSHPFCVKCLPVGIVALVNFLSIVAYLATILDLRIVAG